MKSEKISFLICASLMPVIGRAADSAETPAQHNARMAWLMATPSVGQLNAQNNAAHPPISDARVKELQNLRFGMFICWSINTFSGNEWTPGIAVPSAAGCWVAAWGDLLRKADEAFPAAVRC